MFIAHASSVVSLSSSGATLYVAPLELWQRNKSADDYKHVAPRGAGSRKLELLNTLSKSAFTRAS